MTLSRDEVRLAYVYLLGREPESDEVIASHRRAYPDIASLREGFMASREYLDAHPVDIAEFVEMIAAGYSSPAGRVDHVVPPKVATRLAARIRDQWTKLGQDDPYWSVLTDERYRKDSIDEAGRAAFRESGLGSARLIDIAAGRTGLTPTRGLCVELGCGVGRITRYLAERFERVIAVDISPGNLALCERYLADEGIRNVETRLIAGIEDLASLPDHDYFYSMIVLQHNPPPIQHRILDIILRKIAPGGQCLFQTVADLPGYSFEAATYLATPSPVMEIHSLPMAAIIALVRDAGLVLDLARMDSWIAGYGSYTFSAHRETSRPRLTRLRPRA